ncbi:MAG: hypothetical protein WCJ42_03640 [Actinomycetes bacterium]
MYAWLWRKLPGPVAIKALVGGLLVFLVIAVLFTVVFPWAEPRLPFNQVTVATNSSPTPSAVTQTGTVPGG